MDPSMIMSSCFSERRDSYVPSMTSSSSMGGSFESSFSSDMSSSLSSSFSSPTNDLENPFDINDWSSAASLRSITPPEPVYDMTAMTNNMMGMADQSMMFSTPAKNTLAPSMMGYDFSFVNEMYSPLGSQEFLSTPPGLAFDMGSSPLGEIHTPSPQNRREFVVPSQTFLEAFEPSTPVHSSQMSFGRSSPTSSSYPNNGNHGLQYFISPVQTKPEPQSPSPFCSTGSSISSTPSRRNGSGLQAMESSAILHRVTGSGRVRKCNNKTDGIIGFVPEGKYKCSYAGCKSEHAFKRQEHLKRHMKTHVAQKDLQCAYCHKKFQQDRSDNYRSHVKLHSKKDSKGSRTKYFPAAEEEVRSWSKDRTRAGGSGLAPSAMTRRTSRL